ncbi:PTS system mannose-specific IIC component [Elusimicrobium simillimum]|uniref:PTS sugar transporter subunit IIC n=1 Tax=Elusimicrobium simillimum TaxID=3143438 RepID=UPI003C6F1221
MQVIIILCFVAALLELDNVIFGQIGLGRPFVCGIIFGALIGDVGTGLQLGIFIELLFLDYTPVGGVLPPNGTVATACAVGAAAFGAPVYAAFFYGVLTGLIFRFVEMRIRLFTGKMLMGRQVEIVNYPIRTIKHFVYGSILGQFIINFFVMFFAVYSVNLFLYYGKTLSPQLHLALHTAYMAVPWMGAFVLFRKFRVRLKA